MHAHPENCQLLQGEHQLCILMRPFRFFFGLSLAVLVFLFFARFLVFAFVAAMVLSGIFFLVRRAKYFFQRMDWEEERWEERYRRKPRHLAKAEDWFYFEEQERATPFASYKTIRVE